MRRVDGGVRLDWAWMRGGWPFWSGGFKVHGEGDREGGDLRDQVGLVWIDVLCSVGHRWVPLFSLGVICHQMNR